MKYFLRLVLTLCALAQTARAGEPEPLPYVVGWRGGAPPPPPPSPPGSPGSSQDRENYYEGQFAPKRYDEREAEETAARRARVQARRQQEKEAKRQERALYRERVKERRRAGATYAAYERAAAAWTAAEKVHRDSLSLFERQVREDGEKKPQLHQRLVAAPAGRLGLPSDPSGLWSQASLLRSTAAIASGPGDPVWQQGSLSTSALRATEATFQTPPTAAGYDELLEVHEQYRAARSRVEMSLDHREERRALVTLSEMLIVGADEQFAVREEGAGRAYLQLSVQGLDIAVTTAAMFHPVSMGAVAVRTLAEVYLGYNLVTGEPTSSAWSALILFAGPLGHYRSGVNLGKSLLSIGRSGGRGSAAAMRVLRGALKLSSNEPLNQQMPASIAEVEEGVAAIQAASEVPGWNVWEALPKQTVNGREYAVINGRLYSDHAVGYMTPKSAGWRPYPGWPQFSGEPRGIPPSVVENALTGSRKLFDSRNGKNYIIHKVGKLEVVEEVDTKIIVTIGFKNRE